MGWEAVAMAALSGVGTKMQMDAQDKAANRQQAAMNAALEQQDRYSQQAEQIAMQNAQEYRPEERVARFDRAREAAGDSLAGQLVKARDAAPIKTQASGRLSQTFNADAAQSQADQLQESINMARLMGKMRGAGDMLTEEGYRGADYATQAAQIGRNARGSYNAAQPGIAAAGRVNSGAMLAGGLVQGIGMDGLQSSLGKSMAGMFGTQAPATIIDKGVPFIR